MNASRSMSDIERVKDAADIVQIVGEHVTLKAKGREYVGLCPFHDDHTPSMCVVPAKQIFHCFVCGAGGDVLSFIQRYHRMEFREALEFLADRCNITLTPFKPRRSSEVPADQASHAPGHDGDSHDRFTRRDLAQANAQAAAFYRAILNHPQHGQSARTMCQERGIDQAMVERFAIGAAPDRWDGLLTKIHALGHDPALYHAAGLLKQRDDGSYYDCFRNRLLFPIRDQLGRVIAFGGRRLDEEDDPKYLNSPETPLFHKSSALFGLYQAHQAIQQSRIAILTEGYTDVIACHQAGIEHVVAALGTALTEGHARLLRRLCDTVILLFDGDEAGQRAADRAVEIFFAEPLDVRIATLNTVTDAKDPDELLKRPDGKALFDQALAHSRDILTYRFERLGTELTNQNITARERLIVDELDRLADLGFHKSTPIRQRFIVSKLMTITGLEHRVLYDHLNETRQRNARRSNARASASNQAAHTSEPTNVKPDDAALVGMISCILTEPSLWVGLDAHQRRLIAPDAFHEPAHRAIAQAFVDLDQLGGKPDLSSVLNSLEHPMAKSVAVALQTQLETAAADRVADHFRDCLRTAQRHAASSAPLVEPATNTDAIRAADALVARLRDQNKQLGPNRRVVPKATHPPP